MVMFLFIWFYGFMVNEIKWLKEVVVSFLGLSNNLQGLGVVDVASLLFEEVFSAINGRARGLKGGRPRAVRVY